MFDTHGRPRLPCRAGVRDLEDRVIELVDREACRRQPALESLQCRPGIGTEAVVTERYRSLAGQLHCGLVVPGPQHAGRDGGWINPVNGGLATRQERDGAEPQQTLDGPGVVAEGQNEECFRKDFHERRHDEEVPRIGVAECRAPFLLGYADDELCGVSLHLLHVLQPVTLPAGRHESGECLSQLDWQSPVSDVKGAVLAGIEDRLRTPNVVADHCRSRARRAQHEYRLDAHKCRNCPPSQLWEASF